MISKELLSEVLGKEVIEIGLYDNFKMTLEQNEIIAWCDNGNHKLNVYELAHKCKEWASDLGYELYSTSDGFCGHNPDGGDGGSCYWEYEFYADTEPEAIFQECQWILDNKDKK